ncbi:unnamed protein product [Phytophthora fragariaefolia]|uniref:Unnamed protein product n=1 Tax=Phytophthora fragariaefolia TaxID=1490495 RepID=A0A9W6XFW6_9STRA|nr:unnamed protein product [Phytophthora fragariaefolia]
MTSAMGLLVVVALWMIKSCASNGIMDMVSSFMDLEGLAEQAAKESSENTVATKSVDSTYPLSSVEMNALLQMYRYCRTQQSVALKTWCTGVDANVDAETGSDVLCPRGVLTHPCSGRVLRSNDSADRNKMEFLWPWQGLRCDAFTDPTTVTHM